MITDLSEITPDKLDEIADEMDEKHFRQLLTDQVERLGHEYQVAVARATNLEAKCKLRTFRLYRLGFKPAAIAKLFGVERNVITRWLRDWR